MLFPCLFSQFCLKYLNKVIIMDNKTSSFEYRVSAESGETRISKIQSPTLDAVLECATPPDFPNGIPGVWSPETYFLAAIAGCYLNTFQALADKFGFVPSGIRCDATGKVALVDGKFGFTEVTISPQITLAAASEEATATKIAEKAHKYCLISNSIKCPVLMSETIHFLVPEVA
jgi:organic hydroperoxide reductase OsmC/OhrA